MHTRHLTSVALRFNPFHRSGRVPRLFAALLPPDARAQGLKISTTILPREDTKGGVVEVVFSDGERLKLRTEGLGIKDVVEEVERRTRILGRREELNS